MTMPSTSPVIGSRRQLASEPHYVSWAVPAREQANACGDDHQQRLFRDAQLRAVSRGANDGRDQQDGQSQVENQDPPAVAQLAFPVAEDRGHRGLVACGLEGCGLWKAMANRFQLLAAFVARVRLAGRECSNSLSADAHKESVACMSALWVSASAHANATRSLKNEVSRPTCRVANRRSLSPRPTRVRCAAIDVKRASVDLQNQDAHKLDQ
jgi:hypothetical protein